MIQPQKMKPVLFSGMTDAEIGCGLGF